MRSSLVILAAALLLAGCTVHPQGEREERHAAIKAGEELRGALPDEERPKLPDAPTGKDLVRYALATNGDVEKAYWEWRAAIEQIPQDGTQATNLALFAGTSITDGGTSSDRTNIGLGNDPMADIVLPSKLSAAGKRALENARAVGFRYRKAQFDLRSRVVSAYADYVLGTELVRLQESDIRLLDATVSVADARSRTGGGSQRDLFKTRNELDLAMSEIATGKSTLKSQLAALNILLGRQPNTPITLPSDLEKREHLNVDDAQILSAAARDNPELAALAREVEAGRDTIKLAKLQYLPDISLTGLTDLKGTTQTLSGMITVPLFRYEAIKAAVDQANAHLSAAEASRRQMRINTAGKVVQDLVTIRDAERQLDVLANSIVPRTEQLVQLTRAAYETGQASLTELLDAQRSLIVIRRLVANIEVLCWKRTAELEAAIGRELI
jgi:cobalt-zinc-cadmium efflux system outer membrane protein